MTIRLTSPEAFDRVLEKLKKHEFYNKEDNDLFFKYGAETIKEGLSKGGDEWYLHVVWNYDSHKGRVEMILQYSRRSEIMTDEEYLKEDK